MLRACRMRLSHLPRSHFGRLKLSRLMTVQPTARLRFYVRLLGLIHEFELKYLRRTLGLVRPEIVVWNWLVHLSSCSVILMTGTTPMRSTTCIRRSAAWGLTWLWEQPHALFPVPVKEKFGTPSCISNHALSSGWRRNLGCYLRRSRSTRSTGHGSCVSTK